MSRSLCFAANGEGGCLFSSQDTVTSQILQFLFAFVLLFAKKPGSRVVERGGAGPEAISGADEDLTIS